MDLIKDQPGEFAEFLKYSRSLKFEEKPNYDACVEIFEKNLTTFQGFDGTNFDYCWSESVTNSKEQ